MKLSLVVTYARISCVDERDFFIVPRIWLEWPYLKNKFSKTKVKFRLHAYVFFHVTIVSILTDSRQTTCTVSGCWRVHLWALLLSLLTLNLVIHSWNYYFVFISTLTSQWTLLWSHPISNYNESLSFDN